MFQEKEAPDFRMLARARGLKLTESELDKIAPLLESLDAAFRPLARRLPHDIEPAIVLSDAAVAGE